MEIKIVNNKVICEFFSDAKHSVQEEMQIMQAMKDIMISISNKGKEETSSSKPNIIANATPKEDRNIIRKRIPNNVVDLNEIDIQKAKEVKALIRCPNCGQGHCVLIRSDKDNTTYMLEKSISDNDFKIILAIREEDIDNFRKGEWLYGNKDKETKLDYFNKLQEVLQTKPKEINNDFLVDNSTLLECPVCGYKDTFKEWNNAYKNPLEYFNTDQICDICGGEMIKTFLNDEDGIMEHQACDECGYEKYRI